MNNFNEEHFELHSITVSKQLNFAYSLDHPNLENDTVRRTMQEKEKPHTDLEEAINAATQAYANALGYDTEEDDAWLSFKPTKLYVRGVTLKVDMEIVIFNAETISVSGGPYLTGLSKVTQQLVGEAYRYITYQKRTVGEKYEQKDLFIGKSPEEYTPEEPEMEDEVAESDLDHEEQADKQAQEAEEQREPALV